MQRFALHSQNKIQTISNLITLMRSARNKLFYERLDSAYRKIDAISFEPSRSLIAEIKKIDSLLGSIFSNKKSFCYTDDTCGLASNLQKTENQLIMNLKKIMTEKNYLDFYEKLQKSEEPFPESNFKSMTP